jgi:transcription initiation factor IIF auxiliary subunit
MDVINHKITITKYNVTVINFDVLVAVITKPPYEVNESGWGEFEITIKIFFMDPQERPVSLHFNI